MTKSDDRLRREAWLREMGPALYPPGEDWGRALRAMAHEGAHQRQVRTEITQAAKDVIDAWVPDGSLPSGLADALAKLDAVLPAEEGE